MEIAKKLVDFVMLVGLIIFRHEGALVYFKNMGFHWFWTFLIITPVSSTVSLSVYGFFKIGPARRFTQEINRRNKAWLMKWRFTRKIVLSHSSYHARLNHKKESRVSLITRAIERGGKVMIFLIPLIPLPFSRSGTVLATRIHGTQGAMKLILTAITIRVAAEVGLYYWKGEALLPFLKHFSVLEITGLLVGIFFTLYLLFWLVHSVRDGHWKAGRFDEPKVQI